MSQSEYVVEWDKIYEKALPMSAVSLFAYFCALQGEAAQILADRYKNPVNEASLKTLMDAGLVVQSGNSLRIPREYFRFL